MSRDIDARQELKILKFYMNGINKEVEHFNCLRRTGFIDLLSKCALSDGSLDKFSYHIDRVALKQKYRKGSKEHKAIANLKEEWTNELKVIRKCTDCYESWADGHENSFTEVCRRPHLLVFVRDKFVSDSDERLWPAKVLSADNVTRMVAIEFFGENLRAEYKFEECFLYSAPQETALKELNQAEYIRCFQQVDKYIENVKKKFCTFVPYCATNISLTDVEKHLADMYPDASASTSNCAKELKLSKRFVHQIPQARWYRAESTYESDDSDDSVEQDLFERSKRIKLPSLDIKTETVQGNYSDVSNDENDEPMRSVANENVIRIEDEDYDGDDSMSTLSQIELNSLQEANRAAVQGEGFTATLDEFRHVTREIHKFEKKLKLCKQQDAIIEAKLNDAETTCSEANVDDILYELSRTTNEISECEEHLDSLKDQEMNIRAKIKNSYKQQA